MPASTKKDFNEVFWVDQNLGFMAVPYGGKWIQPGLEELANEGVQVLVSLLTPGEAAKYRLQEEEKIARQLGMEFISFPINDGGAPRQDQSALGLVGKLASNMQSGRKTVVHCLGGVGRSGSMMIAALVWSGMDMNKAVKHVEAARGEFVPETNTQIEWLQFVRSQKMGQRRR
jgi:protein-tyrosine phosphatase